MNVLKRKLPLGAVAFAIVLVLAAMGLVYGNWSQTLSISGTVTTGGVSAEWQVPTDSSGTLLSKCIDNEGGKDVAQMTQEANGKTLNVTILNGYPNYFADCEVELLYTGQTPGAIVSVSLEGKNVDCVSTTPSATGSFAATCGEVAGEPELFVEWVNGLGCTTFHLQSGEKHASSLKVSVMKFAKEKHEYQFNIDVEITQWDKVPC